MKHIGILQTGKHSDAVMKSYGDYPTLFRQYFSEFPTLSFSVFHIAGGEPAPDTQKCDAWIITGSAAAVYEYHPWIPPLEEFIRDAAAEAIPTLGICFGHQIMAQAFGGKVVKSCKGRGLGIQTYEVAAASHHLLPGTKTVNLIASHQDQVVELPPNAAVFLQSDFCPYAGLTYGKYGMSFQPHPEFSIACAADVAKDWQSREPIPDDQFITATATYKSVEMQADKLKPVLRDFLLRQ